ncbi:MAG: hypothetical protein FWF28_01270, partial [Micrococcales bacterium]|nr:hypothetical protein [Micrococcales bacterium]
MKTSATTDALRVIAPGVRAVRRTAGWVATAVAVLALAWFVVGIAGAVVLASAWLLGAGLWQVAPALRGPVIWAAGAAGEFAIVVGALIALAVIDPGPHRTVTWLAVLVAPALVGVILLVLGRRRPRRTAPPEGPHCGIPATITALILAIFAAIGLSGDLHAVTWAMSGDARNHALILRSVIAQGGLTFDTLSTYPAATNGFSAVLEAVAGRGGGAGQLILDDARAMAAFYVLSAIAIGALLAAAVLEAVPALARGRRATVPVTLLCVVVAAGSMTPLTLGMTLSDGYLSAYGALVPVLAALVFALRFFRQRQARLWTFCAIAVATGLAFISWTILAAVPFVALLAVEFVEWRELRRVRVAGERTGLWPRRAMLVVGGATMAAIIGLTAGYLPVLMSEFAAPGAIQPPVAWLPVLLVVVGLAVVVRTRDPVLRVQLLIPTVAGVAGMVIVILLTMLSAGPGLSWTYYAIKTDWLVACSLLWVPFVPIAAWAAKSGRAGSWPGGATGRVFAAVAGAAAAMVFLSNATTAPEPVTHGVAGWNQPSAATIAAVITAADDGKPFVLWDLFGPVNDTVGNFWAVYSWATADGQWVPDPPGIAESFKQWTYEADENQLGDLCEMARMSPGVTVYTAADGLAAELNVICPYVQVSV